MGIMKFELEKFNRNTSNEELIADIKRVATDIKKSPTMEEYNERGSFNCATLMRRFGNWFKVLEVANLSAARSSINISEEELFQNLEEMWTKLGRQPRSRELEKPLSKYSEGPYRRCFGTWRNALERFVAYINNEEHSSLEDNVNGLMVELNARHKTKRDINWRLRYIVMRRDKFKCKICGKSPATDQTIILHVDHTKAWANNGETVLDNLQTLCSKCNIGKSDLDIDD